MELTTVWFLVIAGLWIGYFVLEGFDFGVGILLRVLGRDEPERRAVITTIGPVWDGNEVWLVMAGAMPRSRPSRSGTRRCSARSTCRCSRSWSALILRGVAIEYRGKRDDLAWRSRMDTLITIGSLVPALLWGIAFANLVRGVPLDARTSSSAAWATLLNPFALLGGVDLHRRLRQPTARSSWPCAPTDELRERANRLAARLGLVAAVLAVAFLWLGTGTAW